METKKMELPNHIAIILDGNGRWANKRGMPRNFGHKKGSDNLIKIAKYCNKIGLKELTVYAFSTENWKRPKEEVNYLINLLKNNFISLSKKMDDDIKIKVIGEENHLSSDIKTVINNIQNKTKDNKGLLLNIAFNYGSKDEIINAVNQLILDNKPINKDNLSQALYTSDVDLLIRTSGEYRISNFLLWQIAYSELYFTDVLWPDFNSKELDKAIDAYNKRDRRFGGLMEDKK